MWIRWFALFLLTLFAAPVAAQNTAFIYQGRLLESGDAPTGLYDFEFALFGNATGGDPLVLETFVQDVPVAQGVFVVQLDFGSVVLNTTNLFLQIRVREDGTGPLTLLTPRQRLTRAPRAGLAARVGPNGVDSASVVNGSIRSDDIANDTLTGIHIQNGSLQGEDIAANSLNGHHITDGTIKGADIDDTEVQRRVTGACTPGSSFIRRVLPDGSVECETDSGIRSLPILGTFTVSVENGGRDTRSMLTLHNHLCVLSEVHFRDVDNSDEDAICRVFIAVPSGTNQNHWFLEAVVTPGRDADVTCRAICMAAVSSG